MKGCGIGVAGGSLERNNVLTLFSWAAVVLLAFSYWFQIWKTHVHKEVRDISLTYHVLLALGFGILIFTAVQEGSTIFTVKQIATFIPVCIIIMQIIWHKRDRWHDDIDPFCSCGKELELNWKYCPWCKKESNL
jgi:uncharacterized protein with PQ loop repeat